MTSIALAYRIGLLTAHSIVKETCEIISNVLSTEYLNPPTLDEWKNISTGFWQPWNFPNTIGAMDGKHIQIQAPPKSGSLYFNYKKTFSLVLMAICDHEYKFTVVDVGAFGSDCDAGVLSKSVFGKALYNRTLNISHETRKLPGCDIELPYFVVDDEAFQLHKNVMRPYSSRYLSDNKSIFNYRLSRARRTIENAFGILVSRWRILRRPICAHPSTVDRYVLACVNLHNFLMTENAKKSSCEQTYCPTNFVDHDNDMGTVIPGRWRDENEGIERLRPCSAHRATREAYEQRDILTEYLLSSVGEVTWQYERIHVGSTYHTLYE
ncbi:uncharacterized protein LOC120357603 [Solenopsis invicta]|uniref:uncharacterized protein LOC120357603 n=1 Tax=Solenopsis invicta TaxID=13686 RepID=UPI00193D2F6B|nr:uncharacterized protein LOC120357603 [Solenopsis invicta]